MQGPFQASQRTQPTLNTYTVRFLLAPVGKVQSGCFPSLTTGIAARASVWLYYGVFWLGAIAVGLIAVLLINFA